MFAIHSTQKTTTPGLSPSYPSLYYRAALIVLFALLLLSLAARTFFMLWEPVFDGALHYDEIHELGAAYWPMNLYVGGPGYAVSWVAVAFFMVLLGRGRSAVLNLVGALLAGLGGIVFTLVITAEVLPFAYAADQTVMSELEGRALFDLLNDQLGLLIPTMVGTTIAIAVGTLLVFISALITGATPRWFAWCGVGYLVVFIVLPVEGQGHLVTVIGYLLQVVLVSGLGWFGLRAGLSALSFPTSHDDDIRTSIPSRQGDDHDNLRS